MKKILSLALALMMVIGLVPMLVQTADAATVAGGNRIFKGTPTIDGVINVEEWGARNYIFIGDEGLDENSVAAWFMYDDNYLYFAAIRRKNAFTYAGTGSANASLIEPRLDTDKDASIWSDTGDVSLGRVSITQDGKAECNVATTIAKGSCTYDENTEIYTSVYEMAIPLTDAIKSALYDTTDKPHIGISFHGTAAGNFTVSGDGTNPDRKNFGADLVEAKTQTVLKTPTAITVDGTINKTEWGTADFRVDSSLTGGKEGYVMNNYQGDSHVPETDFYWRHDGTNLYLAFAVDYAADGEGTYADNYNYEGQYYSWSGCKINSYATSVTTTVTVYLSGRQGITFRTSDLVAGTPKTVGVATVAYTDGDGIAYFELSVPLNQVLFGDDADAFFGYIEYADAISGYQEITDPVNDPPKANASAYPAPNYRRNIGGSIKVRNTDVFSARAATKASSQDVFILSDEVYQFEDDDTTAPSATPTPGATDTPGLTPGLTPSKPTDTPIPAPSTPVTASSFTDVDEDDWYYEDLAYVVEAGLMNGVGGNKFAPGNDLDRSMLVTTLWRLAGEPTVNVNTFDDVAYDAWYTSAVNWAAEEGIVKGYAGLFNPTDGITREQVCAILHRYADMMGYKSSDFSNRYYKTSDWAVADVAWADANGILDIPTDMEDMTEVASRAEIAAMLARFCKAFVD